jgi:hypothetical protein
MSKYNCEDCNYFTNIKQNYDKHVLTTKHKENIKENQDRLRYECKNCSKKFVTNGGLWKHKKTCIVVEPKKVEPTIPQSTPQQPTPELAKETLTECFEKNKDFFMNMIMDEFKNNCGMLENRIIPYNSSNEIVKFDENKFTNEVIQIKQEFKQEIKEVKIANEITNRRIDKLERKFMEYTDNYCMNNMDYNVFVDELEITYKFCKDFSEDYFTPITELIKKSLKKVGLENSPIYYVFNQKEKVIVRVKNEIWKTYYYDEMKVAGVISEIIEPLLNKIREGLDRLSDEKLTRRNAYQQFYKKLDDPLYGQRPILDYGLYEPVFLDTRKIKKLINKKQGSLVGSETDKKKKENNNNDDEEEDDEDDEDEEDEEDEE